MLLCVKWFGILTTILHGDALSMQAMSLPRDLIRSLPCGAGCEEVSHGMPWPTRPAAPAGARTDTCCTATVAKGPTGPLTVQGLDHPPARSAEGCQPDGVITQAYLRNAATDWSYERALLNRVWKELGVAKPPIQLASLSTLLPDCWCVQIGSL